MTAGLARAARPNRAMRQCLMSRSLTRPGAGLLLFLGLSGFANCTSGPSAPVDARPYEQQILAARAAKDEDFKTQPESPIPAAERATFQGLPYFPVDPAFRVPASLRVDRSGGTLTVPTSTSQPRVLERIGTLEFALAGNTYALTAFAEEGSINRLFVPFGDLTNGQDTYHGGRYLDLDRTPTGLYDLDFNRAYHPYCVYNTGYECPYPPRENRLPIAIRAGERLPSLKPRSDP
jgi:uncharacterized protein